MAEGKRVHVLVSGRVQGVSFRQSCAWEAKRLGAHGFVRNLPDGRVEAVFEGTPEVVEAMVAWCRRGPPLAEVSGLLRQDEPATREHHDFRIR